MQSKENKPIDARRLPEIFRSLSDTEKQELLSLITAKTGVSRMAINYWIRGERTPRTLSVKRDIADAVKKVVGVRVSTITLFP